MPSTQEQLDSLRTDLGLLGAKVDQIYQLLMLDRRGLVNLLTEREAMEARLAAIQAEEKAAAEKAAAQAAAAEAARIAALPPAPQPLSAEQARIRELRRKKLESIYQQHNPAMLPQVSPVTRCAAVGSSADRIPNVTNLTHSRTQSVLLGRSWTRSSTATVATRPRCLPR